MAFFEGFIVTVLTLEGKYLRTGNTSAGIPFVKFFSNSSNKLRNLVKSGSSASTLLQETEGESGPDPPGNLKSQHEIFDHSTLTRNASAARVVLRHSTVFLRSAKCQPVYGIEDFCEFISLYFLHFAQWQLFVRRLSD